MKFSQPNADVFVPDPNLTVPAALARTTHLCVAAHQDDIEIMAYHGIAACFGRVDRWFSGVVVTNGAGSPRSGPYAGCTDAEMQTIRRAEQRKAAVVGDYSVCLQLAHASATVKNAEATEVRGDLEAIFRLCRPEVLYLHNPVDKHDTHVAVFLRCLEALRALPAAAQPRRVLGCEVWRDLDWLPAERKVALDNSARPHLAATLVGLYDSQIAGGKRYDLAAVARRVANATFSESHAVDEYTALTWALDLTPLLLNPKWEVVTYVVGLIDEFRSDVRGRLKELGLPAE
jgi:LmbE family N-acetylglucosaminyl deacetylase